MKKSLHFYIQAAIFLAIGIMTFVLLFYLLVTPNVEIVQTRNTFSYTEVSSVRYSETEDAEGLVRQFRFTLDDEIAYDSTLMFRFNHQNADVYLDGERVYHLHTSVQLNIVRTPGGNWAMIPLYREDAGKEVLVELRPVYSNYQSQQIQFLIGSKLSLFTDQLVSALPEMSLCLADMFAGLILLAVAVYFSSRKAKSSGLYALAVLSISLGLWNFTQANFASFILPNKNTLLYYISVTMLAISVFGLVKSVRAFRQQLAQKLIQGWTILYGVFVVVQLAFQLIGLLDIRMTLKIVHGALIVTAILLIGGNLAEWWDARKKKDTKHPADFIWFLGIGVLLDLLNYYQGISNTKLIFVLLAVFGYVLVGGYQLFVIYIRQRQELEVKETQLTMSQITIMMSQIRSHFVFNILNAISGMCKYDPEKADETIVRFSRYLRNNIDIMENDKNIPFQLEMERLEDYVILEQVRFGDRIGFTADIEADNFVIPPLILQPIVENAIKHGISKREEGGEIQLKTRRVGENIVITIEDDGVGFSMEELNKEASVGLRNIRFRLHHLVGGTMEIESQPGVGTTVTLTIPGEGEYESDLRR